MAPKAKAKAAGPVAMPVNVPVAMPVVVVVPPNPTVVGIMLTYWWEHGMFDCGDDFAHDNVNVQWRQFYRQYRD